MFHIRTLFFFFYLFVCYSHFLFSRAISHIQRTLGEYIVDGLMEDKMAGTWVLTLRIPYDGATQDVKLFVAEEAEEAGRSVP